MNMTEAGKWLIIIGLVCIAAGAILYFFPGKLSWIGRLPGDIRIQRGNFSIYFPFTTLILANLIIWFVLRIWRWLH